jgi:hypothetical protein
MKNQKGFTFVDFIICIMIVGVLAAVIVPQVMKKNSASLSGTQVNPEVSLVAIKVTNLSQGIYEIETSDWTATYGLTIAEFRRLNPELNIVAFDYDGNSKTVVVTEPRDSKHLKPESERFRPLESEIDIPGDRQ